MNKILAIILAFLCMLPASMGSFNKQYTYLNDVNRFVTIMADPDTCTPYMGFLDEGVNQTFECSFANSTQAYNNIILFTYHIPEFPHVMFVGCFTATYPKNVLYERISDC